MDNTNEISPPLKISLNTGKPLKKQNANSNFSLLRISRELAAEIDQIREEKRLELVSHVIPFLVKFYKQNKDLVEQMREEKMTQSAEARDEMYPKAIEINKERNGIYFQKQVLELVKDIEKPFYEITVLDVFNEQSKKKETATQQQ